MTSIAPFTGAQRLRQLLQDPKHLVVCPGVFDGLTARLALASGAEALYMTGAGTSLSRLGLPDLGLLTQSDMIANATTLASLSPSTPLIADADTGYGSPVQVARTVAAYARAGVAALHIEDQVVEKRCGHLGGKEIVEREVFYSRLRAAVQARDGLKSDMMIIARTGARQSFGFEEAVERLKEAVKICVDAVFFEAMETREECEKVVKEMGETPVLLNMVPGGVTPTLSVDEARDMGFRVMIFPALCLGPIMRSVGEELEYLKREGKTREGKQGDIREAFKLCGLGECMELDAKAGGRSLARVDGGMR